MMSKGGLKIGTTFPSRRIELGKIKKILKILISVDNLWLDINRMSI